MAKYFARMLGVDYSEYPKKTANRKAGMLTELAVECVEALGKTPHSSYSTSC
jgi:hypothetical protein